MVRGQKLDPVGTQKNLKGKSVSENRKGNEPSGEIGAGLSAGPHRA